MGDSDAALSYYSSASLTSSLQRVANFIHLNITRQTIFHLMDPMAPWILILFSIYGVLNGQGKSFFFSFGAFWLSVICEVCHFLDFASFTRNGLVQYCLCLCVFKNEWSISVERTP